MGVGGEVEVYITRVEQPARIRGEGAAGALWARYAEDAIKLAMIFAAVRDTAEPVVTLAELEREEIDDLITSLVEQGPVESIEPSPTGGAGRPMVLFRAA